MMMMMTDRGKAACLLVFLTFFSAGKLFGQQKDFQSWYELELNVDLKSGIDLSLEAEQRFDNNSLQYDRSLVTLEADYDLTGWFNVEMGLRGILKTNSERRLQTRYRIHTDATFEHSVSDFDCSLRSRLQYGFDDQIIRDVTGYNKLVNRNKLKVDYHIFGTRIGLSAYVESYHLLSGSPIRSFYKMRYSAEIQYMLNFRSDINLRYILEDEFNVTDPLQSHILKLGFSYDL